MPHRPRSDPGPFAYRPSEPDRFFMTFPSGTPKWATLWGMDEKPTPPTVDRRRRPFDRRGLFARRKAAERREGDRRNSTGSTDAEQRAGKDRRAPDKRATKKDRRSWAERRKAR